MPDQLAPCPFCGSERLDETRTEGILCLDCSAVGPWAAHIENTRRLWTTRSNTEAVTESGEK